MEHILLGAGIFGEEVDIDVLLEVSFAPVFTDLAGVSSYLSDMNGVEIPGTASVSGEGFFVPAAGVIFAETSFQPSFVGFDGTTFHDIHFSWGYEFAIPAADANLGVLGGTITIDAAFTTMPIEVGV